MIARGYVLEEPLASQMRNEIFSAWISSFDRLAALEDVPSDLLKAFLIQFTQEAREIILELLCASIYSFP
ncbi:hypothetical protein AVEN_239526-1, partial [Araneus ventricosus]